MAKNSVSESYVLTESISIYPGWVDQIAPSSAAILGLFFILIAFLFKIAAVPFHAWAPDIYEGAPTSITAFFSITPKIAILALLLRLTLYTFYDLIDAWQLIIVICAFLSMFVGTFGAINQNKIKRLFAYSSIAHVGYLLIGLATGSIEAVESLLIYIIIYILMIINVFGILLIMSKEDFSLTLKTEQKQWYVQQVQGLSFSETYKKKSLPLWDRYDRVLVKGNLVPVFFQKNMIQNNNNFNIYCNKLVNSFSSTLVKKTNYVKYITDLSSLSKTNPLLAVTAGILFFSNAGVPPLAGFYGKLNIFLAAMEGSVYFLAFSGILCSVIGAFYSIRLVKILYFHSVSQKHWNHYKLISKENSILLGITFFFTLFFFLSPSFLFTLTHSAALSLCL